MDAAKLEEIYTVDDIYALPEGERAELMDGRGYYMAPPFGRKKDAWFTIYCSMRLYAVILKINLRLRQLHNFGFNFF